MLRHALLLGPFNGEREPLDPSGGGIESMSVVGD